MYTQYYVNRNKTVATIFLVPMLISLVCLMLVACSPDINTSEAIKIAEKDFGCEKILWIDTGALLLSQEPGSEPQVYEFRSHYTYYVVGEKDGQEVYIIIPCSPEIEKPYLTTWCLDHTFSEVVDKFNENGANYIIAVPQKDVYRNFIKFEAGPEYIKEYAEFYNVGCDGDEFYDRLDVKGVFTYQWSDGDAVRSCIVTQENGELKAYKH